RPENSKSPSHHSSAVPTDKTPAAPAVDSGKLDNTFQQAGFFRPFRTDPLQSAPDAVRTVGKSLDSSRSGILQAAKSMSDPAVRAECRGPAVVLWRMSALREHNTNSVRVPIPPVRNWFRATFVPACGHPSVATCARRYMD